VVGEPRGRTPCRTRMSEAIPAGIYDARDSKMLPRISGFTRYLKARFPAAERNP
jgi:hypothetical protein